MQVKQAHFSYVDVLPRFFRAVCGGTHNFSPPGIAPAIVTSTDAPDDDVVTR